MNLPAWIRSRKPSQVYYGWWIVAASSVMGSVAFAIFFRGFSVLFIPLRDSLGISNTQASLVFSLARAEGGVEGPLAGFLIDRFGVRKLLIVGILLAGFGYIALSQVNSFLPFAIIYLVVISTGNNIGFQHAMFSGYNMWFVRRRAFVISLLPAVATLGGVIFIPIITVVIAKYGWHTAAIAFGVAYLVLLPITKVIRSSPESMGLRPDGDPPLPEGVGGGRRSPRQAAAYLQDTDPREFSVPEALRTSAYWLVLLAIGMRQLAVIGILVNLQAILVDWKGVGIGTFGLMMSMLLGVNVIARLGSGLAADRWPKSIVLAAFLGAEAIALLILLLASWDSSPWAVLLYLIMAGIGDSSGTICWAAVGDYFGRFRFATLRGIITFSHSWALIASPLFVGWWADRTGCGDPEGGCSYSLPILMAIGLLGAAALCAALLRKPVRRLNAGVPPED